MRKVRLWFLFTFLVLAVTGESVAFEGRMAGMADPYGLVYDDSDFFIHPSRITDGQGVTYYGYYKFTYTDVTAWNWKTPGKHFYGYGDESSVTGDQYDHDALVGAAFSAGAGRLGLFFNYTGTRSDYNGKDMIYGWPSLNISNDADNFAFRAVYGLPLGGSLKLGAEAQIAYHTETASTLKTFTQGSFLETAENYPWDDYPFVRPHDFNYWDYQLKAGLQGDIGPAAFNVTVRGGSIFSSSSEIGYLRLLSTGVGEALNMHGNVNGYNVGSDIWVRYPVNQSLALPFLFRIDYSEKSYDGGPDWLYYDAIHDSKIVFVKSHVLDAYQSNTDLLKIEVGGGADYTFPSGLKLASGLYYGFISADNTIFAPEWEGSGQNTVFDSRLYYTKYPNSTENQIKFRLSAEKPISADYVARAGLEFFHGWVNEDYAQHSLTKYGGGVIVVNPPTSFSLGGDHWGILGSVGMTVKCRGVELEPFIQAGWQQLQLDDPNGVVEGQKLRVEREREYTLVAAGLAIKF